MFSLITKSRRLDVPIDIILDLFDKLILPILIYGSEVWGHSNLKQPIIEKRMILFWLRLTQDKPQRLIYNVNSFIIKLRNKNQYESQWIEKIVGILQNYGMFHYPLLEKSKSKYGYSIYQLMYKRTNQ